MARPLQYIISVYYVLFFCKNLAGKIVMLHLVMTHWQLTWFYEDFFTIYYRFELTLAIIRFNLNSYPYQAIELILQHVFQSITNKLISICTRPHIFFWWKMFFFSCLLVLIIQYIKHIRGFGSWNYSLKSYLLLSRGDLRGFI